MLQALLILLVLRQHLPYLQVSGIVVLILYHVVLPLELLQRHVLHELIQFIHMHLEVTLCRLVGPISCLQLQHLTQFVGFPHLDQHLILVLILTLK